MTSRMDHNLVNMQKQFCSDHKVDTNTCICLGFHGDGVPYAKGTHKQVPIEMYGSTLTRQGVGSCHCFVNVVQSNVPIVRPNRGCQVAPATGCKLCPTVPI